MEGIKDLARVNSIAYQIGFLALGAQFSIEAVLCLQTDGNDDTVRRNGMGTGVVGYSNLAVADGYQTGAGADFHIRLAMRSE